MAKQYKAPGIAVHQIIQPSSFTGVPDQNVALVGPNASLRLYNTTAAERTKSYVGEYNSGEAIFPWDRDVGDDVVDTDFTKVYFRNALLKFGDITGAVIGENTYNNVSIEDDGTLFDGRGVKVGDVISVQIGSDTYFSPIYDIENVPNTETLENEPVAATSTNTSDAAITVDGAYSGTEDTTYILTVKKGGDASGSEKPIIRVTTVTGDDAGVEHEVSAVDTPYSLGTRGLTFKVADGELVQGDTFTYTTSSGSVSLVKKLTLQQNLPLQTTPLSVQASFYVVREFRIGSVYIEQDQEQVTIKANIKTADPEFGSQLLPIVKADVYVERRIWNLAGNISTTYGVINSVTELENVFQGPLHPDNPLKYALYKALQNAGDRYVLYAAVKDPTSLDSWNDAFNRLSKNRNAYAIVPVSDDYEVKRACANWVIFESTDEINRRKECWVHLPIDEALPVITFDSEKLTLATVIDNPNAVGTSYDYVLVTDGEFVKAGVRAGDEFRIGYYQNADGGFQYEARVIQRVLNDDVVVLNRPFPEAVMVAQRYEVWRPTTSANFGENVSKLNVWNHRRIIAVHPFAAAADGYRNIPGYYSVAAVAALTMSLPPNLASTLKNVIGIDDIEGYDVLSEQNLNDLATTGVTVLAKDDDGVVYVRHALTTGDFETINEREEMSTRNFDSISNYYTAALMQLRGNITATEEGRIAVFDAIQKTSDSLLLRHREGGRSGQLVSYQIVSVDIDEIFQDVINAHIDLELPHMANRIELYLKAVSETSAVGNPLSSELTTVSTIN